jgi:uncharacterized Zn finger protein (UPF0148 family)
MTDNHKPPSRAEILRLEAEAEQRQADLVAEGEPNLGERCPECGALGSLENVDGVVRCIDCDLVVLQHSQLPGMGKA